MKVLTWCYVIVGACLFDSIIIQSCVQVALFPGLPTIQFLITASNQKLANLLQVIKKWTVGRPGNKATSRLHQHSIFH